MNIFKWEKYLWGLYDKTVGLIERILENCHQLVRSGLTKHNYSDLDNWQVFSYKSASKC